MKNYEVKNLGLELKKRENALIVLPIEEAQDTANIDTTLDFMVITKDGLKQFDYKLNKTRLSTEYKERLIEKLSNSNLENKQELINLCNK